MSYKMDKRIFKSNDEDIVDTKSNSVDNLVEKFQKYEESVCNKLYDYISRTNYMDKDIEEIFDNYNNIVFSNAEDLNFDALAKIEKFIDNSNDESLYNISYIKEFISDLASNYSDNLPGWGEENNTNSEELEDEEIEEISERNKKGIITIVKEFFSSKDNDMSDELEDEEIEEISDRKHFSLKSFFKNIFQIKNKNSEINELKAKEEAERKAKEEAERKAKEEAERKAKEEAERKAKEEAERKAKEEAERKAKEEAERKAKEEAERKAKEEAERKAKEEAERKAKEEAERKAKEEAERKAKENYKHILNLIKLSVIYKSEECIEKASLLHSEIHNSLTIRQNEDIKLEIKLANIEISKNDDNSFVKQQCENALIQSMNSQVGDMTLSNEIYKGFCERLNYALIYSSSTILDVEENLFNQLSKYLTIRQNEDIKLKFKNIRYNISKNSENFKSMKLS